MTMKTFSAYLESKGYRPKTVKTYTREQEKYQNWLNQEQIAAEQVTYKDLLQLIRQTRAQGRNRQEVNKQLRGARLYYNYLIEEEQVTENPVQGLYIRGHGRRLLHDLIEKEDLEELYTHYDVHDAITHRNKVILGLMIYQGIKLEEIEKLESSHLKLTEGKIQIPGGPKSNGRTLTLESSQILTLQQYQQEIRAQLLQQVRKTHFDSADRKIRTLFFGAGGGKMESSLNYLLRHLDPPLTVVKIRSSVIAHWLKSKDIRVVQYMAGHKYVSSTERYREVRLEGLQESIKKYHPLNQLTE